LIKQTHNFLSVAIFLFALHSHVIAQCSTTVNTFPYSEDFENSNGNWVTGGNASTWVWGTPNKPYIKTAGSGTKCWVNGGLTGGSYPNNESSWILSPCFDFSSLTNPYISFKIFWNTEKTYDGVTFQYSIDGGNSWAALGTYSDYIACPSSNWFNTSSVNTLGGSGWTGNTKTTAYSDAGTNCGIGGGPNNWVTAQHSLAALAGKTNLRFRFLFGAGTKCNDFDGVGIDDIYINEAPATTADFTYTCAANNTVAFTTVTGTNCPKTYSWDFGDTASGSNNTSSSASPTHNFSSAGTYTVTEVITFSNGSTATVQKNITVLSVSTSITSTINCNGDATGAVTATVNGGNGSYNYSWNTNPVQTTASINNVKAGSYTVTVNATNACTVTSSITLTEPTAINTSIQTVKAKCGNNNGSITTTVSGGITPYAYQWNSGQTTASLNNIPSGNYTLNVTDNNGCINNNTITLADTTIAVNVFLGNDTSFCPGNQLLLQPGSFNSYLWHDNTIASTYIVTKTGVYSVKVTDNNGCTGADTISVTVDCSDIYFPSGFTPNGDGRNDGFGPIGNLAALKNYTLTVYGRWGEILFQSTDPYKKWMGINKGLQLEGGTYVWVSSYSLNGLPQVIQKGTISIIR
jgi:gliding motility-associated-like protein